MGSDYHARISLDLRGVVPGVAYLAPRSHFSTVDGVVRFHVLRRADDAEMAVGAR